VYLKKWSGGVENMENTMKMGAAEIKGLLKLQIEKHGTPDLHNAEYRFTIWCENGPFGGFSCEAHGAHDYQIAEPLGESLFLKNRSRTAVFDCLNDRLLLYSCELG
jgi:hypothetical protein